MKKLAIFGAGGHAKVVADTATRMGGYEVYAFYDDTDSRQGELFYQGRPVRGGRAGVIADFREGRVDEVFVAIGNNAVRTDIGEFFRAIDIPLATLIDPHAILSPTVRVDAGSLVVAGAILNADTHIQKHVIVNTGASVDHDCVVEAGVHLGPHSTLCGGVRVGARSLIGAAATLIPLVQFPADSILGAGSTFIANATQRGTWTGSPARLHCDAGDDIP